MKCRQPIRRSSSNSTTVLRIRYGAQALIRIRIRIPNFDQHVLAGVGEDGENHIGGREDRHRTGHRLGHGGNGSGSVVRSVG